MTNTQEKGSYTYFTDDGLEFTLQIPIFWETIYKGKPRERLYEEYIQMLNLIKKIDKNKYIIDGGANFGLFSVPVALLGYKVLGFEPVKSNYDTLFENMKRNNCQEWAMFNEALSDKTEVTKIYIPECPDNSSLSQSASIANMIRKDYKEEVVKCTTFDDWFEMYPLFKNVGLIKLDLQGSEYSAISGAKEFLKQANDIYLIAEYEDHLKKFGHTYKELDDLLLSLGFKHISNIGNDKVWYKN